MSATRRILVPVHDSASSRAALERARALARPMGAELRVIHVERVTALSAQVLVWGGQVSQSCEELETFDGLHRLAGDPFQVIVDEASEPGVALVVIGSSSKSRFERGLGLPLHERVARATRTPVVVVSAGQEPESWFRGTAPGLTEVRLTSLAGGAESSSPPRGRLRVVDIDA